MKRLLNPTIALITFTIGVATASVWQMSQRWNCLIQDASSFPSTVKLGPTSNPETEKYAVYSAIIKDMYLGSGIDLIVIQQSDCQSASEENEVSDESVEEMRRTMEEVAIRGMPPLKQETIDDFHSKSRKCYPLSRKLDIPGAYVLVDDRDLRKSFPRDEFDRGWRPFYAKYQHSSGIINFSNIGFDLEMNQAFVSTGRSCGGLCGAGYFVLLIKDQGRWKVEKKINTWVS